MRKLVRDGQALALGVIENRKSTPPPSRIFLKTPLLQRIKLVWRERLQLRRTGRMRSCHGSLR